MKSQGGSNPWYTQGAQANREPWYTQAVQRAIFDRKRVFQYVQQEV